MKKATLEKMHDQSLDCSMKLNWAWAISRVLSNSVNNPDIPKWALVESIEAIDHLIGESKSNLAQIGIEIENQLNK
jgi:hypothetical protein